MAHFELKHMAHFELKRSKDKQFTFTLVVGKGKVVLQSETYKRRAGALKGIAAVAREAGTAEMLDLTKPVPHYVLWSKEG